MLAPLCSTARGSARSLTESGVRSYGGVRDGDGDGIPSSRRGRIEDGGKGACPREGGGVPVSTSLCPLVQLSARCPPVCPRPSLDPYQDLEGGDCKGRADPRAVSAASEHGEHGGRRPPLAVHDRKVQGEEGGTGVGRRVRQPTRSLSFDREPPSRRGPGDVSPGGGPGAKPSGGRGVSASCVDYKRSVAYVDASASGPPVGSTWRPGAAPATTLPG